MCSKGKNVSLLHQVLALRRQLTAAEAEITGRASTRKAVIGGTVDRLQRAEASAKQQVQQQQMGLTPIKLKTFP